MAVATLKGNSLVKKITYRHVQLRTQVAVHSFFGNTGPINIRLCIEQVAVRLYKELRPKVIPAFQVKVAQSHAVLMTSTHIKKIHITVEEMVRAIQGGKRSVFRWIIVRRAAEDLKAGRSAQPPVSTGCAVDLMGNLRADVESVNIPAAHILAQLVIVKP